MDERDVENKMVVGSYYSEGEREPLDPIEVYDLLKEIYDEDADLWKYPFINDELEDLFYGLWQIDIELNGAQKKKVGQYCIKLYEEKIYDYLEKEKEKEEGRIKWKRN